MKMTFDAAQIDHHDHLSVYHLRNFIWQIKNLNVQMFNQSAFNIQMNSILEAGSVLRPGRRTPNLESPSMIGCKAIYLSLFLVLVFIWRLRS